MNVIEITGSAIRLAREREHRIVGLESWPVPPGADPLLALAAAPISGPLGRVAVLLHHDDMLLRSMVQPATNPERLDKLVRFEVASMSGDGQDPVTVAWHTVNVGFNDAAGELRLLALVTKQKLIDRLKQSLAAHGGKLAALLPPALGVYRAYRAQEPEETGQSIIIDVGGKRLHLILVQNGEIVFIRTQSPGMDELIKNVAERRGVSETDAAKLITKLGKGAPEDLRELISKQAGALAASITATVRFAKTQMKIDKFEPTTIHLAGAGAQVVGFAETLRERANLPVRLINPFSGVLSALPSEDMDRLAGLPSPWTAAIGASQATTFELDALADERSTTSLFWRTQGAMRVAAALVIALFVFAIIRREIDIGRASTAVHELQGDANDGLVPTAEGEQKKLEQLQESRSQAASKIKWLDAHRRPGRVAIELLAAISAQQDPATCPVVLTSYRVTRQAEQVQVEIEGYAKSAGKLGTDAVLHNFEQGIRRRYAPITSLTQVPKAINVDNQPFLYRVAIKDL